MMIIPDNWTESSETDGKLFIAQLDSIHRTSIDNSTPCCACKNSTSGRDPSKDNQFDAFIYIIVVLSFYALSMVLLMIKYIRREEEEISLDHYYSEFVKRDKFQDAKFKNKLLLQNATSSGVVDRALRMISANESKTSNTIGCRKGVAMGLLETDKAVRSIVAPKKSTRTVFLLTASETITGTHLDRIDQSTLLETEV